ncbi:MAG: magnesium/cobalt transporter CorA [Rhodospirillales bacterium]
MTDDTSPHRSRRHRQSRRTPPGAPPGTLIADPAAQRPKITVIAYGEDALEEHAIAEPEELKNIAGRHAVTWIDVEGLGDVDTLNRLGEIFGIHRLALEDVINVYQRPKVEEYDDHLFVVTRMAQLDGMLDTEQITLFLAANTVITFQEKPGDCFEPVRARLRQKRGQIRTRRADYLAYALLDAVTDAYFPILEKYGERIEDIEARVIAKPDTNLIADIHGIKRDLLTLRRAVWPQREMINALARDTTPFIGEQTRIYLRDCYDHSVQLMDMVETYREIATGLTDIHLSSINTRLNEIMKVLTIIATIFIPLTFITGLYGMNFQTDKSPFNMPELSWYWGYPYALSLMAAVAGMLLIYFIRKGWIGGSRKRKRNRRHTDRPQK